MQDPNLPLIRDLVLIGGGHTHALVARMWAMKPLAGVRLTLINPDPVAPYTGMLPGLIAGHYQRADIMIDLVRLARFAGARLILDRAIGIDRDAQTVILQGRAPLPYDLASLDIGITSDLPDLVGFADFTRSAKPLGDYARAWEGLLADIGIFPFSTVEQTLDVLNALLRFKAQLAHFQLALNLHLRQLKLMLLVAAILEEVQ